MKSKKLSDKIIKTFKRNGFELTDPDVLLDSEYIIQRSGENFRRSMLTFENEDGKMMCLRPDLTVASCIKFLEKYYYKNKNDVRICLHTSQTSKHHDMIILQQKKNFYLPHKHLRKGETYHIIKGSMICVLFSNSGKVKKVCKLKKNDIFRTPINIFHTMSPISNYVIYHESKTGPFLKKKDSIFPYWIKSSGNKETYIK